MTYSATAFRLLISAPRDIPDTDISIASGAISRWNAIYGQQFGSVVVPTNWKEHSVATHGVRPQEALNAQLVDEADIVIALFWHRVGSPTGAAESGTLEEIDRAHSAGAYVGILRCGRDIPQREVDLDQIQGLREFYERIRFRSLVLEYENEAELARHVDAILNAAVSGSRARAEAAVGRAAGRADVWPRIETSESVQTDARGRVSTRRRYQLVLANAGSEPARRVRHRLEPETENEMLPREMGEARELEVLAPGGEAPYNLFVAAGTASQVRCAVQWEDSAGEHENVATLRFF